MKSIVQVENQVGIQVGIQVRDQVWYQVLVDVRVQVWDQVRDHVEEQIGVDVRLQLWDCFVSTALDEIIATNYYWRNNIYFKKNWKNHDNFSLGQNIQIQKKGLTKKFWIWK